MSAASPPGPDASIDSTGPVRDHAILPAVTLDDTEFGGAGSRDGSAPPRSVVSLQVGRFPILRLLGSGGMGAVYAAYDELLDRKVALKVMHPDRGGSLGGSRKQRTLVEARALARLSHPNIPLVYEVGEAHQQVYISMEFIDGQTLADWCSEAPRSWRDILAMYLQAGDGLHAAHQAGIVHRDFKPDNVLVGSDGRPRVVDFGLARIGGQSSASVRIPSSLSGQHETLTRPASSATPVAPPGPEPTVSGAQGEVAPSGTALPAADAAPVALASNDASSGAESSRVHAGPPQQTQPNTAQPLTQAGSISGTPGYMSPEQYVGGDVNSLSDQFSFCAALYEALHGYLPFTGNTLEEHAAAVRGPVRPPPPASKVPIEVQRALSRGLSVDPLKRFVSMGELLSALRLELNAGAGSGALGRMGALRLLLGLSMVLATGVALRVSAGNMGAREGALGSTILIGVLGGAGILRFQTLLDNPFHRRIYLALLLIMVENFGQRLLGWHLGWIMRQLVPFEMIVWAGGTAMLALLGLRGLQWMSPFLLGFAALLSLSDRVPRPLMLGSYLLIVLGICLTWARAGQGTASKTGTKQPRPTR